MSSSRIKRKLFDGKAELKQEPSLKRLKLSEEKQLLILRYCEDLLAIKEQEALLNAQENLLNDEEKLNKPQKIFNWQKQLFEFSWRSFKKNEKNYVMTILDAKHGTYAGHVFRTRINYYVPQNSLGHKIHWNKDNNVLFMSEASFDAFFKSCGLPKPQTEPATSEQIQMLDSIRRLTKNKKLVNYRKKRTELRVQAQSNVVANKVKNKKETVKKRTLPSLEERMFGFVWYSFKHKNENYVMSILDPEQCDAHTIGARIYYHARKNKADIKAFCQQNHNILYMSKAAFNAYFASLRWEPPKVQEANEEHIKLFNDNVVTGLSALDKRRLAKLSTFTWHRVETNVLTMPDANPHGKLAIHMRAAICHYAWENQLDINVACVTNYNILYMSETSFDAFFKSYGQPKPQIEPATSEQIKLFDGRRKNKKRQIESSVQKENVKKRKLDPLLNLTMPSQDSVVTDEKTNENIASASPVDYLQPCLNNTLFCGDYSLLNQREENASLLMDKRISEKQDAENIEMEDFIKNMDIDSVPIMRRGA